MIKLYTYPASSNSRKVRVVLLEKGLEFERVTIDLAKREQKSPEYLKIHPFGTVPALDDEGFVVYDSTIINEYLEDEYPEPPMLPTLGSSAQRARARLFEDFADTSFTPQVGQLMAEMARAEGERDQGRLQRLHRSIERALDYLNHELTGQQFLAGEFSVADIGFAPRVLILSELGVQAATNRPNVDAWIKRMLERPSIQSLQGVTIEPLAGV